MRVVVCDTGPIIHLYEAHCLPLLSQTGSIFLPHLVYLEVQASIHISKQWPEWLQVIRLAGTEVSQAGIWQTAGGLHAGEAEALVLARQKKAEWFLTDDAATRLFVSMLGIEVHGSLGIILWSAAKRHITRKKTEEALNRLEQSSLWLSKKIYKEAREALDDLCGVNK
jgi:predicted nucleic acid-binding protein